MKRPSQIEQHFHSIQLFGQGYRPREKVPRLFRILRILRDALHTERLNLLLPLDRIVLQLCKGAKKRFALLAVCQRENSNKQIRSIIAVRQLRSANAQQKQRIVQQHALQRLKERPARRRIAIQRDLSQQHLRVHATSHLPAIQTSASIAAAAA